jgi:hypothetical protein
MLSVIIILVVNVLVVGFIPALKHGAFSLIFRNDRITVRLGDDIGADSTALLDVIDGRATNDSLAPGTWPSLSGVEVRTSPATVLFRSTSQCVR